MNPSREPVRREQVSVLPMEWSIGPFHPLLPGPMRLSLVLDGEVVRGAKVEGGFARIGLAEAMRRATWAQGVVLVGRLDPEAALFGEWAYCLALEQAFGIEAPPRAGAIRVFLAELCRIATHLGRLSVIAQAAGSGPAFHFMLRERERVFDLCELVTGSRRAPAFVRVGGVRDDVTEGFLERLAELCHRLQRGVLEYNELLTYNEAFVRRVAGRAVITEAMVRRHGITGIPARLFDRGADLRWKGAPGYDLIRQEEVPQPESRGARGDLHQRFVMRLQEILQSVRILQELSGRLPDGPFRIGGDFSKVPAGTHAAAVEAPRGRLSIEVVSDGGPGPADIRMAVPSQALVAALPDYIYGVPFEDLGLAMASLDLHVGEVDQ